MSKCVCYGGTREKCVCACFTSLLFCRWMPHCTYPTAQVFREAARGMSRTKKKDVFIMRSKQDRRNTEGDLISTCTVAKCWLKSLQGKPKWSVFKCTQFYPLTFHAPQRTNENSRKFLIKLQRALHKFPSHIAQETSESVEHKKKASN